MQTEKLGEIITFYSFKGGTGRSMALANLAVLTSKLANLTLMIDWDLEAPGLHKFFYKNISPDDYDSKLGLIELFIEMNQLIVNQTENLTKLELKKILESLEFSKYITETNLEGLYLIKAGKFDDSYSQNINKFNWVNFFYKIPDFFLVFAEYLKERYNYIFIDSRTGFTDTGGICSTLLPDKLCLVFTTNKQSLEGVLELAKKALNYRLNSYDFRPLKLYPIPSRVELAEEELREIWRKGEMENGIIGFQPLFESIFDEFYEINNCDLTHYFDVVQIHHQPKYSYGEEIAVLVETFSSNLSLTNVYSNILQKLILDSTIYTEKIKNTSKNPDLIKVYLSYSLMDDYFAKLILKSLSNEKKMSVVNYYSKEKINDNIFDQISVSNVLVPIITSSFVEYEFHKYEVSTLLKNYLSNENFLVLPIVVGLKSQEIPKLFSNMTYILFENFEDNIEKISSEIKSRIISDPRFSEFDNIKMNFKNDILKLNHRETQFLRLAVSELTYVEIADRLGVSPRTIDGYRENLFEKFNVKSRTGLVLAAVRYGLVKL